MIWRLLTKLMPGGMNFYDTRFPMTLLAMP